MYKHIQCQELMKLWRPTKKLYPQTHTCNKCGARIEIDKDGKSKAFNSEDKQISNFSEHFEVIENAIKLEEKTK